MYFEKIIESDLFIDAGILDVQKTEDDQLNLEDIEVAATESKVINILKNHGCVGCHSGQIEVDELNNSVTVDSSVWLKPGSPCESSLFGSIKGKILFLLWTYYLCMSGVIQIQSFHRCQKIIRAQLVIMTF